MSISDEEIANLIEWHSDGTTVHDLADEVERLRKENASLVFDKGQRSLDLRQSCVEAQAKLAKAGAALQFYANDDNWRGMDVITDWGERARAVLKELEK